MNQYNTDKQYLEKKIVDVDKKKTDSSSLVTTTVLNTKSNEVEYKISSNPKYITTQEFNKVTAEKFVAILKQRNLVNKTYYDSKLTSSNKRIISTKTKHLEVQRKLNSLMTKDFFS